jgi:nicotinic acid mononucleotide adenylyltransferase
VASQFLLSSWEQFLAIAWVCPLFVFSHNVSESDNGQTVAAAATSQVKLCPYNEEEQAIWFHLIEVQLAAAGIKSQKFRYPNALASLPKQVLRDILDRVDVCNESDQPFDLLNEVLSG